MKERSSLLLKSSCQERSGSFFVTDAKCNSWSSQILHVLSSSVSSLPLSTQVCSRYVVQMPQKVIQTATKANVLIPSGLAGSSCQKIFIFWEIKKKLRKANLNNLLEKCEPDLDAQQLHIHYKASGLHCGCDWGCIGVRSQLVVVMRSLWIKFTPILNSFKSCFFVNLLDSTRRRFAGFSNWGLGLVNSVLMRELDTTVDSPKTFAHTLKMFEVPRTLYTPTGTIFLCHLKTRLIIWYFLPNVRQLVVFFPLQMSYHQQ